MWVDKIAEIVTFAEANNLPLDTQVMNCEGNPVYLAIHEGQLVITDLDDDGNERGSEASESLWLESSYSRLVTG